MSVLGNLCRSLYLGAARLFRMILFFVIALISILSAIYLSKVGCGFTKPANATSDVCNSKNSNDENVYGTFDVTLCLIINVYHTCVTIPICIMMLFYMIASTFCFKHYRNNLASYSSNHKKELVFFIVTFIVSLISFAMSCTMEYLIRNCKLCKDPATLNKCGKNISFVITINWFATFLWIGLTGVGVTTYCIFHELVKNKASGID